MNSRTGAVWATARVCRLILAALLTLWPGQPLFAETSEPETGQEQSDETGPRSFGGPGSVPEIIASDGKEKGPLIATDFLNPYYDWKNGIQEKYGYSFGAAYLPAFVFASDSVGGTDDYASSAVLRLFGIWEFLGRGTDTTSKVSYMVEHRHSYTDDPASPFYLANVGYAGASLLPFQDDGWHLTHLVWDQSWQNARFETYVGFIDVTDFVDVYPLTSFWSDFSNYVFSVGAGSIDLPDDAALGVAAGAWLTDSIYTIASIEDMNSDPGEPWDGFDTFFNDNEYFTSIEFGWTGSGWEQYYLDNVHLTFWRTDDRDKTDTDGGWGGFLSLTHSIGENWLAFARGGFADDSGSLLEKTLSIGGGFTPGGLEALGAGDQWGFGANWGEPNDSVFGTNLDDQYALETYYRLQVTRELAITPDVQFLIEPALNPDKDSLWIFGLRARLGV